MDISSKSAKNEKYADTITEILKMDQKRDKLGGIVSA